MCARGTATGKDCVGVAIVVCIEVLLSCFEELVAGRHLDSLQAERSERDGLDSEVESEDSSRITWCCGITIA